MTPSVKLLPPSVLGRFSSADRELLSSAARDPIGYIIHPLFRRRGFEELLFGRKLDLLAAAPIRFVTPPPIARDRATNGPTTFTPEQEQKAFLRFNYTRSRVFRILWARRGQRLSFTQARELVAWQRLALHCRDEIVQANMALVLAMAKRSRLTGVDPAELISEGNMALLRAVDKFDCSRGFKFSTYGCRAILKSFSRVAMRTSRYRGRFPTEFDPAMQKSDYLETRREITEIDCVDELRVIIASNTVRFTKVEETVIRARFALNTPENQKPEPMTLEEVGRIIGVTKERVRQIQKKALAKLRVALEESVLAA
jgi:RNA polymerase sigma factor (sigma-70 family)